MSDLREYFERKGLVLDPSITELRPHQQAAREWVKSRPEPYLFINAPTGSGKTLLLGTIGCDAGYTWTYGVHTIRLQQQVARTFENLPVFTGRGNWDCEIGMETHGRPIRADVAICTSDHDYCEYSGAPDEGADEDDLARYEKHLESALASGTSGLCGYYEQRDVATRSPHRVANYALFLRYQRLRVKGSTTVLLADEAHQIESAVCSAEEFTMVAATYNRFRIKLPDPSRMTMEDWAQWAREQKARLPEGGGRKRQAPDIGLRIVREQLNRLVALRPGDEDNWIIVTTDSGILWQAVWGAPYVMGKMFGHKEPPQLLDYSPGIMKVVMTSATLMGAEFIADMLGLPAGSWAYYDMPSTFPPENRPINYAPVKRMNYKEMQTVEGRKPMQDAIDRIIDMNIGSGRNAGLIHAVSNKYRENILTESRWRGIMTSDAEEHAEKIARGQASVLVAANLTEGWDGVDDLCRFVIMPKVPYPNLQDERTKRRAEQDPRTVDHMTLVAVVQGAGRGVRHQNDYCETWMLDAAWEYPLYAKNKAWLPQSFMDAYHHKVKLP